MATNIRHAIQEVEYNKGKKDVCIELLKEIYPNSAMTVPYTRKHHDHHQ